MSDMELKPEDGDGLDFFRGVLWCAVLLAPFWLGVALMYLYLTR